MNIKHIFPNLHNLEISGENGKIWDPLPTFVLDEVMAYLFGIPVFDFRMIVIVNLEVFKQYFDLYCGHAKTRNFPIELMPKEFISRIVIDGPLKQGSLHT
jgi:hypothetical protein